VKRTRVRGRHAFAGAVLVVVLTGTAGVSLAFQGWRSRIPEAQDWLLDLDSARALITMGQVPNRGTVTSYGSYAPPGTAWLFAPGVAVFSDPRLMQGPGAVILYLGTLIGIVVLAQAHFGARGAALAAAMYALSQPGLILAGMLTPKGQPFFYVWMVYWICQWVARREPRYLAAAASTWAVGAWVFLVIAPAILVVPALWFVYRPPVGIRWPLAAAAVILLVWFPYLRFEWGRGFADIRSQVFHQTLESSLSANVWCEPEAGSAGRGPATPSGADKVDAAVAGTAERLTYTLRDRSQVISRGLVTNFKGPVPGSDAAMLCLTILGFLVPGACRRRSRAREGAPLEARSPQALAVGLGLLALGAVGTGVLIGAWRGRLVAAYGAESPMALALAAAAVLGTLGRKRVWAAATELGAALDLRRDPLPLMLAVALPWLVMLLIAEPGRWARFWWLMAVQVIFLSTAVRSLAAHIPTRIGRWACVGSAVALLWCNPLALDRLRDWAANGWPGAEAEQVQIVDRLAQTIRSTGRTSARVGYLSGLSSREYVRRIPDVRLKIGAEFDFLLAYRHGISNANRCLEGLSPTDDYRVVELLPSDPQRPGGARPPTPGWPRVVTRSQHFELTSRD
jgi:hypothetical protein